MDQQKLENLIDNQIQVVKKSKKLVGLGIPDETLRDIISNELLHYTNPKDAEKSTRHKIHNMVAPYLGDPDYDASSIELQQIFTTGSLQQIETFCLAILNSHASSRERVPVQQEFYQGIFAHTGKPRSILDMACGLNPFALSWMDLPQTVQYHAYDIHQPRINLINQLYQGMGFLPLAEVRDILVDPPSIEADVAFLFKEAHRLEQMRKGCNRILWQKLKVKHLLVSLPSSSLSGHYDLVDRQRHLIDTIVGTEPWSVYEMAFGNEMVFCIEKKV